MQLTGRVCGQITPYHPHSLSEFPPHSVTCTCFFLPETIWEGLSVCNECALKATKTHRVGGSSFDSSHCVLKFHNTGNPDRVLLSRPSSPSPRSGQLQRPELHSHQRLLLSALKKLSRDLITPLQADSCMQPATHTHKAKSQSRYVSVTYQIQLSRHSINII